MFHVGVGDVDASPIPACRRRFGHVSVKFVRALLDRRRDGRGRDSDLCGAFGGQARRLLVSRTVHDDKQWSHTHPYLTTDNRWLIFTSRRDGHPQGVTARAYRPSSGNHSGADRSGRHVSGVVIYGVRWREAPHGRMSACHQRATSGRR